MHIGITLGDPKGIGAEITLKALTALPTEIAQTVTLYGDRASLIAAAEMIHMNVSDIPFVNVIENSTHPTKLSDKEAGAIAFASLKKGTADALDGTIDALVTAPIHKFRWRAADVPYTGHTTYLKVASGAKEVVMMMSSPSFSVALTTIHLPLSDVAKSLTSWKIYQCGKIAANALKTYYKKEDPAIGVAALNPHASDGGIFGTEEEDIIMPAIEMLKNEGLLVNGPIPADTLFWEARNGIYDVVIAHYHDQGLAPIKALHFFDTVNITLGIPFIRTSPDHGTADSLAWQNKGNASCMIAAIKEAYTMFNNNTDTKECT
jgi:4-hydroxythreonine-4-phosphate dehydrogenase